MIAKITISLTFEAEVSPDLSNKDYVVNSLVTQLENVPLIAVGGSVKVIHVEPVYDA